MDFGDLKSGIDACRKGLYSPSGKEEVAPLSGPDGLGIRRAREVTPLDTPWQQTVAIAFSPDGQYVAAAGMPAGVCVWDVRTGAPLATFMEPRAWRLSMGARGIWCLPIRFARGGDLLMVGGRELSVVLTSGWSYEPVVNFPVVAILSERAAGEVHLVGPDEDGAFPVEAFELSSYSLSARAPIFREEHTTTILPGGV